MSSTEHVPSACMRSTRWRWARDTSQRRGQHIAMVAMASVLNENKIRCRGRRAECTQGRPVCSIASIALKKSSLRWRHLSKYLNEVAGRTWERWGGGVSIPGRGDRQAQRPWGGNMIDDQVAGAL